MQVGVSARAPRQAGTEPRAMRPLAEGDLQVGAPLPYPLYDSHGRMLLAAGVVLEGADTLARLLARGVLRPTEAQAVAAETAANARADPPVAADLVPFPALRRQVEALHVVLSIGGKLVTCTSDYVGTLRQVSVISTVPRAEDQVQPVREGDEAELRLFCGKSVYVWHAGVLQCNAHPAPHVHWRWVEQVSTVVVRRHRRIAVDLPAVVKFDDRATSARVLDLSAGGMRLQVPASAAAVGSTGQVHFELVLDDERCSVRCGIEVRNRLVRDGKVELGVALLSLSAAERMAVAALVAQSPLE